MVEAVPKNGVMDCTEGCVDSEATPAAAAPVGVPAQPPAGWKVEVAKVEKAWNIRKGDIAEEIEKFLKLYEREGQITLFYHDTWGSCRRVKFVVLNADGSYLQEGEWINNSSRKNAHIRKVMPVEEFMKYAGKELVAYAYVSPSCNKAKQFSFRAVFRVVVDG